MSVHKNPRLTSGITFADVEAAIAKLSDSGVRFETTPSHREIANAIGLSTGTRIYDRSVADIILHFIAEPKALKEPPKFQPLKQSRAMEIAQSRIRADFAPVSVSGTKR